MGKRGAGTFPIDDSPLTVEPVVGSGEGSIRPPPSDAVVPQCEADLRVGTRNQNRPGRILPHRKSMRRAHLYHHPRHWSRILLGDP